jgi:hypothetical protein
LVVTLVVLVFARDIARSAHNAITNQRSENRSFAALANTLIIQENQFDVRLARLLRTGASLSRPVFDARLDQLDQELSSWATTADLLRRPKLAHDVNDTIANLTESRVDDYEQLLATIAKNLTLPAPSPRDDDTPSPDPAQALYQSARTWNKDRFALRREPGTVRLDALTNASATYFRANGDSALTTSSSLAVVRGIGIAAVSVVPAPLPAPTGVLLLPPVSKVKLGISIVNTGFVEQRVTLVVVIKPINGPLPEQGQTFHVRLAPLQAYAFAPQKLRVVPSERATLYLRLTGAPASANLVRSMSFRVEMSPSGHS